jgi:polyribonucleotide nucleotidyltransferase
VRPRLAYEGSPYLGRHVKLLFKKLVKQTMALMVEKGGKRVDGRGVREVRPISIEADVLPVPHGSVLFTRCVVGGMYVWLGVPAYGGICMWGFWHGPGCVGG